MPQIIEIDPFIPADHLVFSYQKREFPVPGDPPLTILFELMHLNEGIAAGVPVADQVKTFERLYEALLEFFRLNTPSLESLPFGRIGVGVITRALLQFYGLVEAPAEQEEDADRPPTTPTEKSGSARPRRSRRSSGSSSS